MDGRIGLPLVLSIGVGQMQRLLVDAGSTVVVLRGTLEVRYPFAWLAEHVVAPVVPLAEEEALVLESGGWVDLHAADGAEIVVMAPAALPLWQRLRSLFKAVGIAGGRSRTARAGSKCDPAPVAGKAKGVTAYGH